MFKWHFHSWLGGVFITLHAAGLMPPPLFMVSQHGPPHAPSQHAIHAQQACRVVGAYPSREAEFAQLSTQALLTFRRRASRRHRSSQQGRVSEPVDDSPQRWSRGGNCIPHGDLLHPSMLA